MDRTQNVPERLCHPHLQSCYLATHSWSTKRQLRFSETRVSFQLVLGGSTRLANRRESFEVLHSVRRFAGVNKFISPWNCLMSFWLRFTVVKSCAWWLLYYASSSLTFQGCFWRLSERFSRPKLMSAVVEGNCEVSPFLPWEMFGWTSEQLCRVLHWLFS